MSLSKARVVVAGGGALGSSIAFSLARAGAQVVLAEPREASLSASGVAAGMLAPAMECALDARPGLSFEALRQARDLWRPWAAQLGEIGLSEAGGAWIDLPDAAPRAEAVAADLQAIGAALTSPPAALSAWPGAVFTPDDWRLAPLAALAALERALTDLGGRRIAAAVTGFDEGRARLSDGSDIAADFLVVAAGAARGLAPELERLEPIKGQILKYPTLRGGADRPAIRSAQGYGVGGDDGLSVGATMEFGLSDTAIDAGVVERLSVLAGLIEPRARGLAPVAQAAVRGAFPDRPPLFARSARPGVLVAAGARRNGWLLAPLAAEIITDLMAERDPGERARPFGP